LGRQQKHHVGDFERANFHSIVNEMGPSKGKQKLKKNQQKFIAKVKNARDIGRENQQPYTKCTTYSEVRGPGTLKFVSTAFDIAGRETSGPHHGPVKPVRDNVNSAIPPQKGSTETLAEIWSSENLNNEHYANQEKMDKVKKGSTSASPAYILKCQEKLRRSQEISRKKEYKKAKKKATIPKRTQNKVENIRNNAARAASPVPTTAPSDPRSCTPTAVGRRPKGKSYKTRANHVPIERELTLEERVSRMNGVKPGCRSRKFQSVFGGVRMWYTGTQPGGHRPRPDRPQGFTEE